MKKGYRERTPEFKFQVVMELLLGEKTGVEICREHQLPRGMLYRWREQFLEHGARVFKPDGQPELKEERERVAELERMVGRLAVELEASKKVSSLLRSRSRSDGAS